MTTLDNQVDALLSGAPYQMPPPQRVPALLEAIKAAIASACARNASYRNYVQHWPVDYRTAPRLADLPFLPVGVFKTEPPLALVEPGEVTRTLTSSATTGQVPSRVVLDAVTARRMTRGVTSIVRDFIGAERRPYLVIDTPEALAGRTQLGARGAAVQGLRAFATEVVCCLKANPAGEPSLDLNRLFDFAARWKGAEVLVYGFTYALWNHLVQPLRSLGRTLNLPGARVLHSGGWKRLQQQAVTKEAFTQGVASAFGCAPERVLDFYGLVENVGVVYPDCPHGNKHVPAFAEVLIRNPLTLRPVLPGEQGLVQVCSALPGSFPGFLVLTEDLGRLVAEDGCPCGRRGTCFQFVGRAPKTEVRGCGNVETRRERFSLKVIVHD